MILERNKRDTGPATRAEEPFHAFEQRSQPPSPESGDETFWTLAGAGVLRRRGFGRLYRAYRQLYESRTRRDLDYFARMNLAADRRQAVTSRVRVAIKTIQAFQAWWGVSASLKRTGFYAALICGSVVTLAQCAMRFLEVGAGGSTVVFVTAVALFGAIACASLAVRSSVSRETAWLMCLLALALFLRRTQGVGEWSEGLVFAANACIVYLIVLLTGTSIGQAIAQIATRAKITKYPEDEIVQSLLYTLGQMREGARTMGTPQARRNFVEQIEWVARRLESNFAGQFNVPAQAGRDVLREAAGQAANALRALQTALVLPQQNSIALARAQLTDAFYCAASGRWGDLPRAASAATTLTKVQEVFGGARNVSAALLPLAAAIGVWYIPSSLHVAGRVATITDGERWTLLTAAIGYTFTAIVSGLDPKHFESRLSAVKTFSDVIGKG